MPIWGSARKGTVWLRKNEQNEKYMPKRKKNEKFLYICAFLCYTICVKNFLSL